MPKRKMSEAQEAALANLEQYQYKRKDFAYDPSKYQKGGKWDRAAMLADARKIAKANNQRLLRLEKAGLTSTPAYRGAVKALSGQYSGTDSVPFGHVDKAGRPRYKENVKNLTNEQLRHMLYTASKTSTAHTITAKDARAVYQKSYDALSALFEKYGFTDRFSMDDFIKLVGSEAYRVMAGTYGYKAILQAVEEKTEPAGDDMFLPPDKDDDIIDGLIEQLTGVLPRDSEGNIDKNQLPPNLLELRKKLGLDVPKVDLTKGWHMSV